LLINGRWIKKCLKVLRQKIYIYFFKVEICLTFDNAEWLDKKKTEFAIQIVYYSVGKKKNGGGAHNNELL